MEEKAPEYTPSHIANFFIASSFEDDIPVGNLKLNKLVYIAYSWYLAIMDKKLFNEEIQAWKYGPVIPSLYYEFNYLGRKPISRYSQELFPDDYNDIPAPDKKDKDTIKILSIVWDFYKKRDAVELVEITHQKGSAWSDCYEKGENKILKDDLIKKRGGEGFEKYLKWAEKKDEFGL